ncbi:hypothetical protein M9H77_15423 [Catharanthus roseus]|uniref:Uncharacterized protein n=1 Tax=Catharanthus roseus TaxID=4058 RepID=A0ACC0AZ52_CATRO|nr:hypothetical protein M9H77_15423 [Catharanthus roseus]
MAEGGTEAFPDLGRHCQLSDCHQLDFLPFKCDSCQKVFCVEHRSSKSHDCPKPDQNSRKVIICETCTVAIETTGIDSKDEELILEKHRKSGDCDPAKMKKAKCPVKRCKEVLTFSNNNTCKICQIKVCLKHRFPADHDCKRNLSSSPSGVIKEKREVINNKFLAAFASRNGKDCGNKRQQESLSSSTTTSSIKAY